MIDKIASKLSLYDILAMVIPGATILLFLSRLFSCVWNIKPDFYPNEVAVYFTIIVLSYIIGLLNKELTCRNSTIFRNNPLLLYEILKMTTKHKGYSPLIGLTSSYSKPTYRLPELVLICAFA